MNSTVPTTFDQDIDLSNLNKVFFPDANISKGDVVHYYHRIADKMIPYLRNRPLSMERFPNGIDDKRFYQKRLPKYFPDWVDRTEVELRNGRKQPQVMCNSAKTLVYLANQACLTLHPWLSRSDALNHPDRMIYDFDPAGDKVDYLRLAAIDLHDLLSELNLPSFVMTTGSRGYHVVVPLDRSEDFDSVRDFAQRVARVLCERRPDRLTTNIRKNRRHGRIFVDYLRNAYAQTTIAPFTIRAKPDAPVATPLAWEEIKDKHMHAQKFTIRNIFRRLGRRTDPWKKLDQSATDLVSARDRLARL